MSLEPLTLAIGQPLRVAVYNSIANAIRRGTYPLGSVLPSDAEFCAALGASRPVIREAMLLLEEDRLITTRRGVGRFVTEVLPHIGLERLRPLEDLLADSGGSVDVERVLHEPQRASELIADSLGIGTEAHVWAWESVVRRGQEPLCLTFEAVSADLAVAGVGGPLREAASTDVAPGRTLLAIVLASLDHAHLSSTCDVSAGVLGERRASQLGMDAGVSALILTQRVAFRAKPLLFAKHVVLPAAGTISLQQVS
jgi:GntR family transcriptional regulator